MHPTEGLNTIVVDQTLVLRINPDCYRDGENCHLCQARKRYAQFK